MASDARRRPIRWLLCLLVLAAVLRLPFLDSGLPEAPYVDAFKVVDRGLTIATTGNAEPTDFQYPGFFPQLLAAIYRLLGLESTYATHLAARAVSAFLGLLLIVVTWRIGRQAGDHRGALLAAALVATSVLAVTLSRLPITDTALTFLMACSLLFACQTGRRAAVLAGAFLGLAIGTKLTGLYATPFVVFGILGALPWGRSVVVRVATTGATAIIAFILTTPWILVYPGRYLNRFLGELALQRHGQIGRVQNGYFDYLFSSTPTWELSWLGTSLLADVGPVALLLMLAGVAFGLSGRGGRILLLHAALVAIYLLVVSGPGRIKAARFLLPILPSLAIVAGAMAARWTRRWQDRPAVLAATLALIMALPAWRSARVMWAAGQPTTQVLAHDWIASHLPRDASVFVSPLFLNHVATALDHPLGLQGVSSRQYRLPGDPKRNGELAPIYTPALFDELQRAGVTYFVSSSAFDGAHTAALPENRRFFPNASHGWTALEQRLQNEGEIVYQAEGWAAGRPGPDITIYRLP